MRTLKEQFLGELKDMHEAERRIARALPKMAAAVDCDDLKAALRAYMREAEGHAAKIERIFSCFDDEAGGDGFTTAGLPPVAGEEIAVEFKWPPSISAALISVALKVEHYAKMASYGGLHEWAELLGNAEAATLLREILDEDGAANRCLTKLARARNNKETMSEFEAAEGIRAG